MRVKKRFPFGGKASVELDFEVLNVFDNINFNHDADAEPGHGGRHVPRDRRLHRHQHDVRSGRPHRADRLAHQLVR